MTLALVAEGDAPLRRIVAVNLEARGYAVVTAASGEGALAALADDPGALVVDLGLPDIDGAELVRRLRHRSAAPLVVLATGTMTGAVTRALTAGADDVVAKPFAIDALLERLAAVLRTEAAVRVVTDDFRLDLAARTAVRADGRPCHLDDDDWALLRALVRRPDVLVTRDRLAVSFPAGAPDDLRVRACLGHIRRELEPDPARPRYVVAEPPAGYRFRSRP